MSTPGDDDPPGGSPPTPTSAPATSSDATPEPSIVVEPAAVETSGTVAVSGKATGSIGRPFSPRSEPDSDGDRILPASLDEDALADAVGVKTSPKQPKKQRERLPELDDDGNPPDKNRKTMIVIGAALVAGVGISALVLLGRVNTERYVLTCTAKQAIAERGRAFPPWGTKQLFGAEWKAIALPPNAQCKSEELDAREKLEGKFLDLLIERTSAALTVRNLVDANPGDPKGRPSMRLPHSSSRRCCSRVHPSAAISESRSSECSATCSTGAPRCGCAMPMRRSSMRPVSSMPRRFSGRCTSAMQARGPSSCGGSPISCTQVPVVRRSHSRPRRPAIRELRLRKAPHFPSSLLRPPATHLRRLPMQAYRPAAYCSRGGRLRATPQIGGTHGT